METINNQDKEYFDGRFFNIYIGSYGEHSFKVYCTNDLQSALEMIGEYCRDSGYHGLLDFRSYDELLADCDNDEDIFNEQYYPINGGEYYLDIISMIVEYNDGK